MAAATVAWVRVLPVLIMLLAGGFAAAAEEKKPPETVLVYEAEGRQVDMAKVVQALDRRINTTAWLGLFKQARIRELPDRRVEVVVSPSTPEKVQRIERMIERQGTLEFRILADPKVHADLIERAKALAENVNRLSGTDGKPLGWWVPVEKKEAESFRDGTATRTRTVAGEKQLDAFVIKDKYDVDGRYVVRATVGESQGFPTINFTFNVEGGRKFGQLTTDYLPDEKQGGLKYRLGIILDGVLYSAPSINSVIYERGQITGRFTRQQAEELVAILNAGALPAKLKKVSKQDR